MTPLSLIIAAYNRGPKIAMTLDSVLKQTIIPDEIIVVDDCSPDGTGEWVSAHYPQVRVLRTEKNIRTSAARNLGARTAMGRTLMFLDHDDELLPHAVETLLELRTAFPEARAAFADHAYINFVNGVRFADHHSSQPAFARLRTVPVLRASAFGRLYGKSLYFALLRGNLLQQPWVIDRDFFHQLGGFAEEIRYCEDWDLYLRAVRAGPIALTDRVISNHYVEGENLHLHSDQATMHLRVLERQLRRERFRSPRATLILRRKLAGYFKASGDQLRAENLGLAWRHYARSFWNWPFDLVVAGRLLLWPLSMIFRRHPVVPRSEDSP